VIRKENFVFDSTQILLKLTKQNLLTLIIRQHLQQKGIKNTSKELKTLRITSVSTPPKAQRKLCSRKSFSEQSKQAQYKIIKVLKNICSDNFGIEKSDEIDNFALKMMSISYIALYVWQKQLTIKIKKNKQ
jgi:hypothetical protein